MSLPQTDLQSLAESMTWMPPAVNILRDREASPLITSCIEEKLNSLAQRNELFLPNLSLHNKSVVISSDYGGEHQGSKYVTYSFLFSAYNALATFQKAQEELRKKHGLDDPLKEIAFKTMGYGPQDRAMRQYLNNLSNLVPGLLITVVLERGSLGLWGSNKREGQRLIEETLKSTGFDAWDKSVAEKLVNVMHIASYFASLLVSENQNIFWQTDLDAIVATDDQFKQVGELFSRILNSYTTKKFGKIAYGKTFGKESTLFLDLLSAPDLAAGSIEHYLTRRDTIEDLTIKDSANEVLMWHSFQGVCLKKYAFIFRQGPSNLVESATLKFDAITVPEDAKFIDIRPHAVRRT